MKIVQGNIFSTECQTIVNTVNCVGVMGTGLAFEFRLRYPEMFIKYKDLCNQKLIKIGSLWLYKSDKKWVLCFPTKNHWKFDSKPEYLELGLKKFLDTYQSKGIKSIAFPLLGAKNGGIPEEVAITIMKHYLEKCEIPVEIYYYDPLAYDDLYIKFKNLWNSISESNLANSSGLRIDFVHKVKLALEKDNIRSLNRLLTIPGIGEITLEKSFRFIMNYENKIDQQGFL